MSYRSDIADAIKDQLSGQTDAADSSIFTSLDRPLGRDDLPAIVIYTMTSRRGENSNGEAFIPRVVTVAIEAAVEGSATTAHSAAEELADAIEAAMDADRSLGQTVKHCEWQETVTDVSAEGEVTLGVVLLQYEVTIDTMQQPDSAFEFLDEGFEDAPIPTEVYTTGTPVADAYSNGITSDIAATISQPIAEQPTACEDGSCAIDAWQGDPDDVDGPGVSAWWDHLIEIDPADDEQTLSLTVSHTDREHIEFVEWTAYEYMSNAIVFSPASTGTSLTLIMEVGGEIYTSEHVVATDGETGFADLLWPELTGQSVRLTIYSEQPVSFDVTFSQGNPV
jgi:hypothetical protein